MTKSGCVQQSSWWQTIKLRHAEQCDQSVNGNVWLEVSRQGGAGEEI